MAPDEQKSAKSSLGPLGALSAVGIAFVLAVVFGFAIGLFLDRWRDRTPRDDTPLWADRGFEVVDHEVRTVVDDARGPVRERLAHTIPGGAVARHVVDQESFLLVARILDFLHVSDPHDPFKPYPPYDTLWADPAKREEHERQAKEVKKFIQAPLCFAP